MPSPQEPVPDHPDEKGPPNNPQFLFTLLLYFCFLHRACQYLTLFFCSFSYLSIPTRVGPPQEQAHSQWHKKAWPLAGYDYI